MKLKRSLCVALVLVLMLSLLPLSAFAKAGDRLTGDEKLAYDALVPLLEDVAAGRRSSTVFAIGTAESGYPVDSGVTFTGKYTDFDYGAVVAALRADHPYEMFWYGYGYSINWRYYSNGNLAQVTFKLRVAQNYRGSDQYTLASAGADAAALAAANAQAVVKANAGKSDYEKLIAYRDYICNAVTYNHYAADNNISSTNIDPWQLIYVFDGDSSTNVVCEGYSKAFKYLCDLSDFNDESFACHLVSGWMQGGTGSGGHMWNLVTLAGQNYMVDVTNSDSGTVGQSGGLFLTGSGQDISADFRLTYSDGSEVIVTRYGYRFVCGSTNVDFYYDEDTVDTWGWDALELAGSNFVPGQACQLNGHSYRSTVITSPTCLRTGLSSYVCTVCGDSYNGATAALGHSYSGGKCVRCGCVPRIASGVCGADLIWELDVNGCLTLTGSGAMYNYEIGSAPWASYRDDITQVVIPEGVTRIGNGAFVLCRLTSVTLPGSLRSIGENAFLCCFDLTSLTVPDGVTSIERCAFQSCSKLASVKLHDSVTTIDAYAFAGCDALKNVYYTGTAAQWAAISIGANNAPLTGAALYCDWVAQPSVTKLENTASGIRISWSAVSGAGKYRVFVKTSSGWAVVGTTTGTSLTYTGAKSGSTYTFTVRCLNAAGTSYTSFYNATGWKQQYVAQPSISRLENTANGIKITWNAVSGAGKYRVFVKTSKGWVNICTTTGTSFTYTGAKSGSTYTFTVRALNSAGTAFVSSYNTTGWKQTYVAQPSVSKLENTASGIKITWKAVSGAGKYRVFAKTSKGWVNIGTTTGTSFTYTGAKSGYTYTFTVRALNSAGTAFVSSYSTSGWKQTYIAQPSITKLANTTSGIKITWGAVNGAAKYRVFVKTAKGWSAIGTTTGTSLTWAGATKGTTYTFTVRCVNSAGNAFTSSYNTSGWSVKRT